MKDIMVFIAYFLNLIKWRETLTLIITYCRLMENSSKELFKSQF